MKKLMFGLALVATCLGVQAANIDWAVDAKAIKDADGNDMKGETAYLLMFESAAAASSYQADLADGKVTIAQAQAAAIDSATSTYTSNKSAGKIDSKTKEVSGKNAGDKAYFAILVANGDQFMMGAADQGQFYVPGDSQFGDRSGVTFGGSMFALSGANGWNTNGGSTPPTPPGPGPIPEPTSGLLLLVGGAMLALRRKQK